MSDLVRQLSQALAAFTIEFDNEFEQRMPHRTAASRRQEVAVSGPWLVSQAMWANVMSHVEPAGITVSALEKRARTHQLVLPGLIRWGYVTVAGSAGGDRVTPTRSGRRACEVWQPLTAEIEARWVERNGSVIVELRLALTELLDRQDFLFPRYLPVVSPTQGGHVERPPAGNERHEDLDLSALLAGALHAFTNAFEAVSRTSLVVSTSPLRVLDAPGVPVRDLPGLTGVSKEGLAMSLGWLQRHDCVELVPDPATGRGKLARLTSKGVKAQHNYVRVLAATEDGWTRTYGFGLLESLRDALHTIVDGDSRESSPLLAGLTPYPGNWRATTRMPAGLPHYPMVLHRGGYPDGA